ncbi:hypothetical protein [Erythrobacter sp. A6_0]|uniref:hypothetical protein n=1 Tax=Erythrobacter sp. A6_0 TaxID=2821089 RepID=UPI001ADC1FEE|nr:hypothetical protein [Erythrobacter sp. A6_0]MBO9511758.1 hypothetical protein [Erythrobacter sp. A6_0]
MKFRTPARKYALVAAVIAAPLALAACSDSDDAAYETDTETVEIEANEALENVDAMPVEDPQASMPDPVVPSTTQTVDPEAAAAAEAARQQTLQDEGDDAAATAAAAMDAMNEE